MSLKDVLRNVQAALEAPPQLVGFVEDIGEAYWQYLRSIGDRSDRDDGRRSVGYHPSALGKFCPRREILAGAFPKPEVQFIPPETQMIFDWGSAWQEHLRDFRIGPMGILWGAWRCNTCATVTRDSFMPNPCAVCWPKWKPGPLRHGGYWHYLEPNGTNTEWGIPWKADGFLILSRQDGGEREILEIKTIAAYLFKKLQQPDESYLFQVHLYLWLTGLKVCWITYWTKEEKQVKPKIFRVVYDPRVVEEVQRRIQLHKRALADGRLCEGVCKSDQDPMAVKCAWRGECFRSDIEEMVAKLTTKGARP